MNELELKEVPADIFTGLFITFVILCFLFAAFRLWVEARQTKNYRNLHCTTDLHTDC